MKINYNVLKISSIILGVIDAIVLLLYICSFILVYLGIVLPSIINIIIPVVCVIINGLWLIIIILYLKNRKNS